jgi:anti-sigma regulatory factor (Ser/Thr protein kinase)
MDMNRNGGSALDATFPADANAPRTVRSAFADLTQYLDTELAFRVGLLVSEAVTNRVLDQALGGGNGRVRVELSMDEQALHGRVADVGFDDNRPPGSASAETRDIEAGMMSALADAWGTTQRGDDNVSIWFDVLRASSPTDAEYADRFAAGVAARQRAAAAV